MRIATSRKPGVSSEFPEEPVEGSSANEELRELVAHEQQRINHFLVSRLPRKARLLNVSILGGAAAAVLSAWLAVGGPSLNSWLTSTVGLTIPAWQLLCGAAALCSVTATVATQLLRSQNLESQINCAQRCKAKLEMIHVGLAMGQLETAQAKSEFMAYVEEAALLPES